MKLSRFYFLEYKVFLNVACMTHGLYKNCHFEKITDRNGFSTFKHLFVIRIVYLTIKEIDISE